MQVQNCSIVLLNCCVVLTGLIALSGGCFITNCPIGGKRSGISLGASRQCSVCGPASLGRCFGPEICCGPEMGCLIGTRDSIVCRAEEAYPVPCENKGKPCGDNGGRCAANGICCNTEKCELDESCRGSTSHLIRSNNFLSRLLPAASADDEYQGSK